MSKLSVEQVSKINKAFKGIGKKASSKNSPRISRELGTGRKDKTQATQQSVGEHKGTGGR